MPTTVRGFTAAHFAVELNGTHVGFPNSVSGGESFADVIEEPPVDVRVPKHLGPRRYEPIVIEFGASMAPAWYDAIEKMLEGRGSALDGAIVMLDHNYQVRQRLEWQDALITEVAFPKADGADKTAARLRVVLQPQATSLTSGGGVVSGGGVGGKQKQLLACNFRFAVSGLEGACSRVGKVSAITVHRGDDGVLRVDDIEFTVPTLDAAPFVAWFDGLVDGNEKERTAVLTFLDASLKNEVMRLDLSGVGTFRVANERQVANAEAIARVRVQLYCEGVGFTRSKTGEAKPESAPQAKPPTGTTTTAHNQPAVERLAGALIDALGTTLRTPPTRETIAARLLSAAAPPDETARQRGLAAGRAWAGDEARLVELEDLAAVAERDEWSALALDENHTLRSFLAARGEIPADESAVGDLMRDEFTSGLVAGIAEVHREVAPLL